MATLELVCLSALYLFLLLMTLGGQELSLQQWYHLPAQVRVLAALGGLCILLSVLLQLSPQHSPSVEVKSRREIMEDELSVHSWVAQDFYC